jgi:competence ComEA-like helix-hairpin-helix protein
MTNRIALKKTSNSLLYLALLCLLIFLAESYYPYVFPRDTEAVNKPGGIYVEIDDGRSPAVKALESPMQLEKIKQLYNIQGELKSGNKVILEGGKKPRIGRISGLKSLSLGIPIGLNSATAKDLEALPGIGEKLALRIIAWRNENGKFQDTEALLEVNGMGGKKLARIKPYINLD